MYRLGAGQTLVPIVDAPAEATRRQDLPVVYILNGAVYVADAAWLRRARVCRPDTVAHVMPRERSLDIDSAHDFECFEKTITETPHA